MFTISKIKTIKRLRTIQNYELSDLMGNKLQHNTNKSLKIKNYYQEKG